MTASLGVAEGAPRHADGARRILLLGNGHGEDTIAANIADALRPLLAEGDVLEAWPLVGSGAAYRARDISLVAPGSELPSEGFGTLSAGAFVRDLRAGWLGVHLEQVRTARRLRGRYDLAIAVGDIVPIAAAALIGAPFCFVGCAKSVYFGTTAGYDALERSLLRRHALVTYPRDERTAAALARRGVRVRYVGNPMMDGISHERANIEWSAQEAVVAVMPGSRRDREANAAVVLAMIAHARDTYLAAGLRHFAFALPGAFDLTALRAMLAAPGAATPWRMEEREAWCGPIRATFSHGVLGDVCAHARVAIGLAGTANEQAVGLGVPVVTFATEGPQNDAYLRMKMPYFGPSAIRVDRDAAAVAEAVSRIATDSTLHARMAAAGRERMGTPGSSAAIAADVVAHLEQTAVG